MNVPEFETPRLRMRGHTLHDFAACAALWADPVVTHFIGGKPFTAEDSWLRLLRNVGHWALLGYGYWVVEERATGQLVGEVGFADLKRDMVPALDGPEAGWVLASAVHGKGYATESLAAIHAWAATTFDCLHTTCIIHPDNTASIRVAEKCGYRELARSLYRGAPTIVFRRQQRSA